MPIERAGDPWAGATYNGFSKPGVAPVARRTLPRLSNHLLLGGIGGAVALGLIFGFVARPNLVKAEKAPPMQAVTRVSTGALDIEVAKPVILPAPKSVGRLEVLPADMVRNAPRAIVVARPAAAPEEPQPYAEEDEEIDGPVAYDDEPRQRDEARWDDRRWREDRPRWRDGPR